jgi:hypothetical protein
MNQVVAQLALPPRRSRYIASERINRAPAIQASSQSLHVTGAEAAERSFVAEDHLVRQEPVCKAGNTDQTESNADKNFGTLVSNLL